MTRAARGSRQRAAKRAATCGAPNNYLLPRFSLTQRKRCHARAMMAARMRSAARYAPERDSGHALRICAQDTPLRHCLRDASRDGD